MRPDFIRDSYDLEALEPRLLLSADPLATLLDHDHRSESTIGDSVALEFLEQANAASVASEIATADDLFAVADEPLSAPPEAPAIPPVSGPTVELPLSTARSAVSSPTTQLTQLTPLAMESQTLVAAQTLLAEQQITSLKSGNGPPERAAAIVASNTFSDLLTFISSTLNVVQSDVLPKTVSDTYTFTNDLALGGVFTVKDASVTFNVTISGTTAAPVFNGSISITAGQISLTLGSLTSATVTDGPDTGTDALVATYSLSNATVSSGGTFSLALDQISLTAFSGVLTATGSNFAMSYSQATGLATSDLNFTSVSLSLSAGGAGSTTNVLSATGSGLVRATSAGVAAAIDLTLSQGPAFAGQSIVLTGTFKLRLNTTGTAVTSIGGVAIDLPSPGGATYVKVIVQNANLTISGATLTATELTFEKAGDIVTITGTGTAFTLKAGATQIIKASSDAFAMQFTGAGFVAGVVGASVQGPSLSGFTLTGVVDFLVNSTGGSVTLPVIGAVPAVAGDVYVLASIRGATAGTKASLAVSQSFLEATTLTFEKNAAGVSFSGTGLSVELRAGAKRIVGVSGASAAFQFIDTGFFGAIINASVTGPDFFDGPTPLFALAGVVSLRINSTTSNRTIVVGGQTIDLGPGAAGQPFVHVTVSTAVLTVAGSSLTATSLTFQQASGVVDVGGENVSFELKAGSKRIVGVSNATFAMRFSPEGFVAGFRNATVAGPDFGSTFTLTGTIDLDLNTTGAAVLLTPVGTIPGVTGSTYIRASVSNAVFVVAGSSLTATTLMFEKAGTNVTVTGTGLDFALKAGTGVDAKKIVGVTVASFGFVFTPDGMVASIRDGTVSGPQFTGFTLTGTVSLDINTTGASYTFSGGALNNVVVPGVSGGTYLKVRVTGNPTITGDKATLAIPGASLAVSSFEFEKNGTNVSVSGTGLTFEMRAGTGPTAKRIVGINVAAFGLSFTPAGLVASVRDGTVTGPDITGFTLTGTVSLDLNTTGASHTFVGGALDGYSVPGVAGDTYIRVRVTGNPNVPGSSATLVIPGATLSVALFDFTKNGTDVSVLGSGLVFELKAGSKRIVKIDVASFGFIFTQAGMVAAVRDGTVTGPDITGFTLSGSVSLDINTTGSAYTFGAPLAGVTVPAGAPGATYLKVTVTGAPAIPNSRATLGVLGSELSAASFSFESDGTTVSVAGTSVILRMAVGGKNIIAVKDATFAFAFVQTGFYGAMRNATLEGPDFGSITLSGKVSFDVNTTGLAQSVTLGGGIGAIALAVPAGGGTYVRVELAKTNDTTPATLAVGSVTLQVDKFVFEKSGDNVAVQVTNLVFRLGTTFTLTGNADLLFTPTEFRINNATLGANSLSVGSFLSVVSPQVSLTNFVVTSAGTVTGTLGISAISATIFPGKTYTASITDGADSDTFGLTGTFNIGAGNFALTIDQFSLALGTVLTATASNVQIQYDPNAPGPQTLVNITSATVNVPRFGVTGMVNQLQIREDGFKFDSLTITRSTPFSLGSIVEFQNLTFTITNFEVIYAAGVNFTGAITVTSTSIKVLPGKPFTATATGVSGTLDFSNGKDGALTLTAQSFTLQLGTALTATATGITINTSPGAGEYVASFVSISATINTINLTGTLGYTGSVAGYNTRTFAFGADGTFHTFDNFGFKLATGGAAGASGFSWPTWLPIQISEVTVNWPNINTAPTNFVLTISATVTGLHGMAGLTFSGGVTGLQIDMGKLIAGEFPITAIGGVTASVSGNMFGGEVQAGFFLEMLHLQRANNSAAWVPYTGSPTAGYQTRSVVFAGLDGSMTFAGMGVQIRVGLSELGPLSGFIRADVPILLEPFSGLTLSGLRGGIQFHSTLPTPSGSLDLRGKAYQPPGDKTIEVWKGELRTAVVGQANTSGGAFSAETFSQPMLITAGASLYSSYTSKQSFRAEVDLVIDTTGKILINAAAVFGDNMTVRTWFFGDLVNIKTGAAKFVFLTDMPEKVGVIDPTYTIGGSIEFKFVQFTPRVETFVGETGTASGSYKVTLAREIRTVSTVTLTVGGTTVSLADFTIDQGAQTVTYTGMLTGAVVVNYESVDPIANPTALADPNAPAPNIAFNIIITGVARWQAPAGGLFAQMTGEIALTFNSSEFRIRIAAELSLSMVGALGVAGGEFIIRTVNGTVQVFGALQLQAGTKLNDFLKPKGLYVDVSATSARVVINTTNADQNVSIRFPKPGTAPPYDNNELTSDTVTIRAGSFGLLLRGKGELRDPANDARLLGIEAVFAMEITAAGMDILAVGSVFVGPADAPTLTFNANALLVIRSTGGIAARMSLTLSLSESAIEGVELNAAFHLVLNTTGQTVTYTIPTLAPPIPNVMGPDPTDFDGPAILYEVVNGSTRQLVVPAGPPPSTLADPKTWTVAAGASGPYVVIFGGGTINLVNTMTLTGSFRFEISNTVATGLIVDLRLNMSVTIDPVGTANVVGMLRVSKAGLLASLDLQVTGGTTTRGGFTMTGRFWLEINTTNTDSTVQRLALDSNGAVLVPSQTTTVNIEKKTARIFIGATVQFGDFAEGSGKVIVVSSLSSGDTVLYLDINMRLKAGGSNLLSFSAQGLISVKASGFAGRFNLSLSSDAIPGVDFTGNFHLIVNTTGAAVTFDVPAEFAVLKGPNPTNPTGEKISYEVTKQNGGRQIKIPSGAPPAGTTDYSDWTATAGNYFVVLGGGTISLANGTISLTGAFRIVVSSTKVEVVFAMTAALGPLGNVEVDGGFTLTTSGVVAGINVNLATGSFPGFTLTAKFTLEINTTNATSLIPRFTYSSSGTPTNGPPSDVSITANTIRVFAAGQLNIASVVTGSGTFLLTIKPGLVELHADVTLSIFGGVFSAAATIDAHVYSTGLVLNVTITIDGNLPIIAGLGFKLAGAANLQINTTGSAKTLGITSIAAGMRLQIAATLDLASVIEISGTVIFTFQPGGSWRIEVPQSGALTADFFGLATIRAYGWIQSDGQFDLHVRGDIALGGGGTGLFGSVTFDVSYLKVSVTDANNVTTIQDRLSLSASISGSAKLFGITLAGFTASFSYDSATGKISVRVTVDFLFFSESMTFTLGYFRLTPPAPFRPAGDLADGTQWLSGAHMGGDGVLYLNVGSRASYRSISTATHLIDSGDEMFTVRSITGSPTDPNGETIEIVGLGRKATYAGVKKIILLDTGAGENVIVLGSDGPTRVGTVDIGAANYVLSPFYANGGTGKDLIAYYGNGNAALGSFRLIAGGDPVSFTHSVVIATNGGADYIEIGEFVSGTVSLSGGTENDVIIHNGTGSATISGGSGNDTIYGGSAADVINGDGGEDRIIGRGGNDTINAGADNDHVYWMSGHGADAINGGGEADALYFIATNDADSITLTSASNSAAALNYVRGSENITLSISFVETIDAHLGQGANTAIVNDLLNSGITTVELRFAALVPTIDALIANTALAAASFVAPDLIRFNGSTRDDEFVAALSGSAVQVTQKNGGSNVSVTRLHGITRPGNGNDDILEIKGAGGSDRLDAHSVTTNLVHVKLFGEDGTDGLIGTPFADLLDGGAGSDTYTGGASVDVFNDVDFSNTLIEVFDRDMSLFNNRFVSGSLDAAFTRSGVTADSGSPVVAGRPTGPTAALSAYSDSYAAGADVENIAPDGSAIFNQALLVGGVGNNAITVGTSTGTLLVGGTSHAVTPWSGTATLDNRGNGVGGNNGYYIVHLSGATGASISIADSAVDAAALLGVAHLDATPTAGYDELYVVGTSGIDRITLRAGTGHVPSSDPRGLIYAGDPTVAATRTTITHRNLEHVTVRTLAGADVIDAERTVVTTVIESGADDDVINLSRVDAIAGYSSFERWAALVIDGGAGADAFTIGTSLSTTPNTVNVVDGHVSLHGGDGSDGLTVNDFGDTSNNTGHLTSSRLTGLGMGTHGITYATLETLTLNLGTGSDTLSIGSTHAGSTTVTANAGDDIIIVGSTAAATPGVLDNIAGALTITGGTGGVDRIIALDNADASANAGKLTATTLTGLDMAAGITYGEFEQMEIYLGTVVDALFIETTHVGTTLVDGGAGDDIVRMKSIQGVTTVNGGAGNDRFVVNVEDSTSNPTNDASDTPPPGAETKLNGIGATLNLDGQAGNDRSWIYAANLTYSATHHVSLMNVVDSGNGASESNRLRVYGTELATKGDTFLVRRNFIALISGTDSAERINYSGMSAGVRIDTRDGDDFVAFDDTGTTFDVNLGAGNDRLQVGQMFDSPRVFGKVDYVTVPHPMITGALSTVGSVQDEITTLVTTQGWLSVGTSHTVTVHGDGGNDTMTVYHNSGGLFLFGDDGDDTFIIRAFALYGSTVGNPDRELTTLNTGAGSDLVEYAANAPVAVDGGTGFDTLIVIATEFSDRLVISESGISGAGLAITFVGVERVTVYGAQGDDIFIVLSTAADVEVSLWGGLGSDTFLMGGVENDPDLGTVPFDLNGINGPLRIEGGDDPLADYVIARPLLYLTDSNPNKFVRPLIVTLFDKEEEMIDRAIFNNSATAVATSGTLDPGRIWGLRMGAGTSINGRTFAAGVVYGGIEMLQVLLGTGSDVLQVNGTQAGASEIVGGPGNDRINIISVSGHTTLDGGLGDDTFNLGTKHVDGAGLTGHGEGTTGAPQGTLDRLGAAVVVVGGGGSDTLNADQSGEVTSDVALVTGTAINSLNLRDAIVWTVKMTIAFLGEFSLNVTAGSSTVTTGLMKTRDGAVTMRDLLRTALGLNAGATPLLAGVKDVVVDVAGDVFTIIFATDDTVAPSQISLAPTLTTQGIIAARSALNLLQTLSVNATSGTFLLDILNGTGVKQGSTLSFAWDVTAETLRASLFTAFKSILGVGNVFLRDFIVTKQGNTFFVAYQGQLKGPEGSQLVLRAASPTHTIASVDANTADLTLNASAGTYRLLLGAGLISTPIAFNADASAITAAIGHALGATPFTVVAQGSGFRISYPGATALGLDARNLVALIDVATRTHGISYFGITTLNLDMGAGSDVINVRGTAAGATTNIWANGGDDKVFVSSLAAETLSSAPTTRFLEGNLDHIQGTLNFSLGTGRHKLMISDEAALAGDGSAASRARVTDVSQFATPTSAELWITGLSVGSITFGAASSGYLADGVTLWTGWGADQLEINGAHHRAGVRTTTSVNTGLGNDDVIVGLNTSDGHFVLNAQGSYNAYLGYADDDTIDGSSSSRSLILFGGQGADTLKSGSADDFIFGDRGLVDYLNGSGLSVARFGTGGPSDYTDGVDRSISTAIDTDLVVGAGDTIFGGAGDDVVMGSAGNDRVDGGIGQDLLFGDHASLVRSVTLNMASADPRFRTLTGGVLYHPQTGAASQAGIPVVNPAGSASWSDLIVSLVEHSEAVETGRRDLFGNDYIAGGAGRDLIFGGLGNDVIQGDGSIEFATAPSLYRVDSISGLMIQETGALPTNVPAGSDVGAWRGTDGVLYVRASVEAATDGDDYIEGNGGNDTIFGGLGQDDIVGGSSSLFGLNNAAARPDGSDLIFGGAGSRIGRGDSGLGTTATAQPDAHARDSDTILGDNGNIYRAVGANGQLLQFGYDNVAFGFSATLKIVPRVTELLDYTPGGVDALPATFVPERGAGDEIHGEGGDDFIYGMRGDDVLYGDAQDDDLIGGTGADWISGGTGMDGLLGDDGRLWTSRNGTAEPLYGIAATPPGGLNQFISTAGKVQQATINVTGALKKTALIEPFNLGEDDYVTPGLQSSNDILFGGLGGDWIHGGAGDDAISGAEALAEYFGKPVNSGNTLAFGVVRAGEFAAYDEYNPLKKVYVAPATTGILVFADRMDPGAQQFILNFVDLEDDGDDELFGDLGNDWIVGGRGRDHLYGGWGDDLLNGDDLHDTNGGANDAAETSVSYEDIAFGGAGRDILIGNTGGDRLIDWAGEFNSFIVPFAPFGLGTVSRALQPQIAEFLYALSGSGGADTTRAGKTGAQAARNGEPFGELGLVLQADFAWQDQTGAPDDPQPGNVPGGRRDVLRSANFDAGQTNGFFIDSGTWTAKAGRVEVAPSTLGRDAVAVLHVGDALPIFFELRVTMNAVKPVAGYKANGYLIFDYQSPTDFKFVGLNSSTNKMEMGHRNASGWVVDVQAPMQIKSDEDFNLALSVNGTTATLVVDNKNVFAYAFAPRVINGISYGLNNGLVGIGADNAKVSFDNVSVQVLPPAYTLQQTETYDDGIDNLLGATAIGTSSIAGGRLTLTPAAGADVALRTANLKLGTNSIYQLQASVRTAGLGGVVFDYYGANDYKFAAVNVVTKQVVIGHVTKKGLVIDATVARNSLTATGSYQLEVSLKGSTVSVAIDGSQVLGHVFNAPVVDGQSGVFSRGGISSFDSFTQRTDDPRYATAKLGASTPATYSVFNEMLDTSFSNEAGPTSNPPSFKSLQ